MPLAETLPIGPGTAQWSLWSTTARLVVTDPGSLPQARGVVTDLTARVEAACSRFRPDSELSRLPADGRPVRVSALLAELVAAALLAARRTDGDVDPTLGDALAAAGYDRTFVLIGDGPVRDLVPGTRLWEQVRLDGDLLHLPTGVRLDLGATAKAWTADRCARAVVAECGGGALVALGGDIATAGDAPAGGWRVLVRDLPDEPGCQIALEAGGALATSSTVSRTWRRDGRSMHHILDPRTGAPAAGPWRTVSVAAASCEEANTVTTAGIVRGLDALPWLRELGVPARLVGRSGKVLTLGGWPADDTASVPTRDVTA